MTTRSSRPRPFVLRAFAAGAIATLTMDLCSGLGRALGVLRGVDAPLFARWLGLAFRGHVVHEDIATARDAAVPLGVALAIHYLIGVTLAAGYLALVARARGRLGPVHAVGFGLATSVFAWLVMFPAMGFGLFGFDAPPAALLFRTSLSNHLAYGIGLAVAVHLLPGGVAAQRTSA